MRLPKPSKKKRSSQGFLSKSKTKGGKAAIARRRKRGRKQLSTTK